MLRRALVLVFLLAAVAGAAAGAPEQAATQRETLEVYVRDGCPHCAAAKAFLATVAAQRPELQIVYRPVDRDPQARDDLARHARTAGVWPPGVPTFVFDGQVLVGFESPERTGPELLALLERQVVAPGSIETEFFGTLSVSRLGLPLFTLAIGLLDGFNPCAMWVLLFLLSLLVHLQDRKRMALIAGTFVLVSGLVYYAFLAAWLNLFLVVGLSTAVRFTLAGVALVIGAINVKDFLAGTEGLSLSIPDSAKPGLYARMRAIVRAENLLFALAAAATLAVVVNFVELLCTAGLPALYTAILTQQHLGTAANLAYLGLYIVGYMADDALMVATAVLALSSRKLTERAGRWLKLLSGVAMLLLGAVMALRPEWLL
jgi:glutaredoxin